MKGSSTTKAVGFVRQWASFGAQRGWCPNGIASARNARIATGKPLKYSCRPKSPRKLQPDEVVAMLKARKSTPKVP